MDDTSVSICLPTAEVIAICHHTYSSGMPRASRIYNLTTLEILRRRNRIECLTRIIIRSRRRRKRKRRRRRRSRRSRTRRRRRKKRRRRRKEEEKEEEGGGESILVSLM
jgi:hypothetical protein